MRPSGSCALGAAIVLLGCGSNAKAPQDHRTDAAPDVVELASAQVQAAGLVLSTVDRLPPDTLALTGTVTFDPSRFSHVGPRTQGRIRWVRADVGTHLRAGDTLAVLDSPELGAMQTAWLKARVAKDVAARNFERAERLLRDGIVSQRRHLEAEAELRQREADLAAATQALAASGAEADTAATGLFVLRSPLAGEVVEKHATVGEVVGSNADLFTVGDLGRLWLLLDLYEADLSRVPLGTPARIVAQAFPDRVFTGIVAYIGAQVDSVSRTVKARIEVPNPNHVLKPGMFVRAALTLPVGAGTIGVPRDAVQSVDGKDVVFVPAGPGRFRMKPVRLGKERAGGWVELLDGASPGDTVVIKGSFALKAHRERAGFGEE